MPDIAQATAYCATGKPGSGKTAMLVERIVSLLEQGVCGSEMLVFCASPTAAALMRSRLAADAARRELAGACVDPSYWEGVVTTPQELALELLASDAARAFTKRAPRLLLGFETSFLMEDMKVSGLRPKRLKEMLRFFYRSWTELADDDPNWLIVGEEPHVYALLRANLEFMGGILEPELVNLAVNHLRRCAVELSSAKRDYVFVDDYNNLSRASQQLAIMLAKSHIAVAGTPGACVAVQESYPYAAGIDEFIAAFEDIHLDELGGEGAAGEGSARVRSSARDFKTIAGEFSGIAEFVGEQLGAGNEITSVYVVTPNDAWSKGVAKAFDEAGVGYALQLGSSPLRGDIRDWDSSASLRILSALKLVFDPTDSCAWRCWCGYGDYLTQSAQVQALREGSAGEGLDLAAALRQAQEDEGSALAVANLTAAFRQGLELIGATHGLYGSDLLAAIALSAVGDAASPALEPVLQLLGAEHLQGSAGDMLAVINDKLLFPRFCGSDAAGAAAGARSSCRVQIGPVRFLCGHTPDLLVVSGFVNGHYPKRDYFDTTIVTLEAQAKLHKEFSDLLAFTAAKAGKAMLFSYFSKASLETAEQLQLEIARIRLEDGKRVCRIEPSIFLAELLSEGA